MYTIFVDDVLQLFGGGAMNDEIDDEMPLPSGRWRGIALKAAYAAPPAISFVCAVVAGYFAWQGASQKPPPDMAALATSILKSADASPEMRAWAEGTLGIETDIQMPARLVAQ